MRILKLVAIRVLSLIVVMGLSGAALRLAEKTPVGAELTVRQQILFAGLLASWLLAWLGDLTTSKGLRMAIWTAFAAASFVVFWAFWPVVANVADLFIRAIQ